jgi:hypothetical protein
MTQIDTLFRGPPKLASGVRAAQTVRVTNWSRAESRGGPQVAYYGPSFDCFAWEPGRRSVLAVMQEAVIAAKGGKGSGGVLQSAGRTDRGVHASEKDAKLAQKLGQFQPCAAVFPQECMGQLASLGPT